MPFVNIPGYEGKIYVPEEKPDGVKKHPCPDCCFCRMCGDDRCRVCRQEDACAKGSSEKER